MSKLIDGKSYPTNNTYQYLFGLFHPNGKFSDFVLNKDAASRMYAGYHYLRCMEMFKYNNLPDTLLRDYLEFYLLDSGSCAITMTKNNGLTAVQGSFGGEPRAYHRPTLYVVADPYLEFENGMHSSQLVIDEDCIIIRNDPLYIGLRPLIEMYSYMLAENMLTLRTVDINLRLQELISAPDDNTYVAANKFLDDLENGKIGAISENRFLEGVRVQTPTHSNTSYITQFVELHQYLKGSFYNDIGLESNYNMKRAQISSQETTLNKDSLMPLVELMLKTRREDIDKVNSMFGTDISVEFDSSWAMNEKEIDIMLSSQLDPDQTLGQGLMEGEKHERNSESIRNESESHSNESAREQYTSSRSESDTSERNDDSGTISGNSSENLQVPPGDSDEQRSDISDASDSSNLQMTSINISIQLDTSQLEGGDINEPTDESNSDSDSYTESGESSNLGIKIETSSEPDSDDIKERDEG